MELTCDYLKSVLNYNPDSGVFTRKKRTSNSVAIGDVAGGVNSIGYVTISLLNKRFSAHRLAWMYMNGSMPNGEIDHINRVRDDNRICNLRDVTSKQNSRNTGLSNRNTSGYKGVSYDKKRELWTATMSINGKSTYLGASTSPEGAAEKYSNKEIELYGSVTQL